MKSKPDTWCRRQFVKQISLGSGAVLFANTVPSCSGTHEGKLYKNFLKPAPEAKPFFRWWWNGNRLSKAEIVRELKLMKDAGIGGIEINPIEMPEQADNMVYDEVTWLSKEWIGYLDFTVKKARDFGIITDLIVGTGWPFGGEFLHPEETIQGVSLEIIQLSGPGNKTIKLPEKSQGIQSGILSATLFPKVISGLTEGMDIACNTNAKTISVDVPPGEFELHIVIWQNNFRTVMHGAPGGAGPVLDHFNKSAVIKYLSHISDGIRLATGKKTLEGIRAMFCDSIELNGANWTHGFENIFLAKRGYDLLPYLPLLLNKNLTISESMKDELRRARYDYSLTLAELFAESFILPFHEWCHENGTLSRYQAYGHPWLYTDLIDGYLILDIPEGDQWLFNDSWQPYSDVNQIRYAIWNKYASSAGNLTGRRIISTEAMTNTSGVFKASLKYIKQATDLNFLTGINHLVLHGFNYSPPEAGFPGWVRYGCYFSEHNPWWPYLRLWSDYCARLSQLFQDSSPVAQVGIMGPTPDIWSEHGLDRNPFNLEPWYLHALWQAFSHNGFGSDYINAGLLKNASIEGGKIMIGSMRYDIIMLCNVKTLNSETAVQIEKLTAQGGRILVVEQKPFRAPSMIGALKQDGIVSSSIENAGYNGLLFAPTPDENLKKSPALLMNWVKELMQNCGITPGIFISNPQHRVFYLSKSNADHQIFFAANMDDSVPYRTSITIPGEVKSLCSWDPETGIKNLLTPIGKNQWNVELNPLQSVLLVCNDESMVKKDKVSPSVNHHQAHIIQGTWSVLLKYLGGTQKSITLTELKPINTMPGFENFGGDIIYKTGFTVEKQEYTTLMIDEVFETAEVFLNNKSIGVSWWGNNRFDLKGRLKKGRNVLEIRVTTLLANYCQSLENNETAQFWTSRYKDKNPVHCGLAGEIKLI